MQSNLKQKIILLKIFEISFQVLHDIKKLFKKS